MNFDVASDISTKEEDCGGPIQPENSYYPHDTSKQLSFLLDDYNCGTGQALEVSFRELVSWLYGGRRASHYLHTYPAKLLPQIAYFFLANEIFCPKDGVVLDPFSGSGTVALETILSGRDAYYCDVNPFARFLTKAKTTPVTEDEIDVATAAVNIHYRRCKLAACPDVVNLSYWYNEETALHLSRLKAAIETVNNSDTKNLLLICFSSVTKNLSRANPRFSVPVRLKVDGELVDVVADSDDVWEQFCVAVDKAKLRVCCLAEHYTLGKANLAAENVLELDDLWPTSKKRYGEIDMIITSPPYAGAQKYVRATSLSLGWLEQVKSNELTKIENQTLGREHIPKASIKRLESTSIDAADIVIKSIADKNPTRAAIVSFFLTEMKIAADKIMGALKPGGYAIIIMADNTICGKKFETTRFTSELFIDAGGTKILELRDKIVSRSLQTKRANTSSSISHETITVFRKD